MIAGAPPSTVTASMSEEQLMRGLLDAARRRGWLAFHVTDAEKSEPGFPDILAVRGDRALALECKTQRGKLRGPSWTRFGRVLPGQADWLTALGAVAGIEAHLVRPLRSRDAIGYDDALELLEVSR